MRLIIILLISLMSFWQAPASSCSGISHTFHLSAQTDHHSKPVQPKQENQEEEDDLADEDEDYSNESIYTSNYSLFLVLISQNKANNFHLVGESIAHLDQIHTPPDTML